MDFSLKKLQSYFETAKKVQELVTTDSSKISTTPSGTTAVTTLHDGMSDDEEEQFIQQQQQKLSKLPTGTPSEVMSTIKAIGEAAIDAIKFCEIQETKREGIRAQRDVIIRRIDKTADLVKTYLDKTFDERRYQFDKYFQLVDKAIENGDQNLLAMTLQNINALSASSPFKELKAIGEAINNPNTEWDI